MPDLPVYKNLTKINFNYYTGKAIDRVKYIVVHYTANDGDTAYGNTKYFKSVNRNASAHYFVDEKEIWQCVDDAEVAWHCGTSGIYYHKYCRNNNSIGVELCSRKDSSGKYYFLDETINNAVWLIGKLMKKYGVTKENVIRHYDVTHKNCPAPFVDDIQAWNNFKMRLTEKEDEEMIDKTNIVINGKTETISRILKDGKNYICLSDLSGKGFKVGYDAETKIPSLSNAVSKLIILIDGKEMTVNSLNIKGYNYIPIRALTDALGNLEIDFSDKTVIITRK